MRKKRINPNDFTVPENRAKSPYRLWVAYKREVLAERGWKEETVTFYGHNNLSPDKALQRLYNILFVKHKDCWISFELRDNQTDKMIDQWPPKKE